MSLKEYIEDKCQEAASNASNYTAGIKVAQNQQNLINNGLMTIQSIDNSTSPPTLLMLDSSQNYQYIQYIGSDYIYPGQTIFCSNGYAQ